MEPNTAIRFIGGRFNGLNGIVAKVCENLASINVTVAGETREVVEEIKFIEPQNANTRIASSGDPK